MGNPNEPTEPVQQPTDHFARPSAGEPQPLPAPPTQQFGAPGGPLPGTPAPSGARVWLTGTRRNILAAGVAGLVIGAVAGGLIGWASTGDSSASPTNTAQSAQAQVAPQQQAGGGAAVTKRRGGTSGTITAINGSSWTVAARNGKTVTVDIGTGTAFGTAQRPQQQSDFAVGDRIVVLGKNDSGTVDATRIAKRAARPGASTSPSTVAPGASTQPS